jgi:hypothetical protein
MIPQSVSRGARISGLLWFADCYGLSGCWPPCTDLTGLPANGGFYFQAFNGSVALPAAGYDYNSDWTPLLAGLSPAGMAASLAALARPCGTRRSPKINERESCINASNRVEAPSEAPKFLICALGKCRRRLTSFERRRAPEHVTEMLHQSTF